MRRLFTVLLVLALVVSFVPAGLAAAQEEIVIGGIQDLSGKAVQSGLAMHQGTQLAVDAINEAGGINGRMLK